MSGLVQEYRETVRALSDRLVEAQTGIRVLNAIRWDDEVQEAFLAGGAKTNPTVDQTYYEKNPLDFDVSELTDTFRQLEADVSGSLGSINPAGVLMKRRINEYIDTLSMLAARGTPEFSPIAQQLYGRTSDVFHVGGPSLADLAEVVESALDQIDGSEMFEAEPIEIPASQAVAVLQAKLDRAFGDATDQVRVQLSDGIVADAAAGADYIKLRSDATFSERDLALLEAHEGWVHVGTTLNGRAQPWCTFLAKGPPSTTITQEGLAVLVEITSFRSHPARLRRVNDRVRAIALAENGSDFVEVFHFFRERGLDEVAAFQSTARCFRGSLPDAGPFPKDLAYSRGFVTTYNFLRVAVRTGRVDRIPLLFCGKTTLENIGLLGPLYDEGTIVAPRYLPPQFADFHGLAAWMAYSSFFNTMAIEQLESDYAGLLN